uniref:uncharacterized protein LOC122605820 n=1 Tax=Erigeron canadensis TaxID=72917 RepID=UPI001CB95D1C|nr:uncharacterized protein LOC122605820 [Erigeron canadensis]
MLKKGPCIRFQELKYLCLDDLPMLVGLSNTNDLLQLVEVDLSGLPNFTSIYPEYKSTSTSSDMSSSSISVIKPFFSEKVMIPKLERLQNRGMDELKNIWAPCGSREEVHACCVRHISVSGCRNLVSMFPRNPIPLLHHLETIFVDHCRSIEVLFDIDVGGLGEIKEGSSKLRFIRVYYSDSFREVFRLKGIINPDLIIYGFEAVEEIRISDCLGFSLLGLIWEHISTLIQMASITMA